MTVQNPPGWLENAGATHTAEQMRSYIGGLVAGTRSATTDLMARGGVNPTLGNALAVIQQGTPDMTIIVQSGVAYIPGSEGAKQGIYCFMNDANVTVAVPAAHATLPRIDLVVARVYDSDYSGASNTSTLEVIEGTAAGSPVAPTAPANSLVLAHLAVSAADTSIVTGDITSKRKFVAGIGGVMHFLTEAEMNAVTFNEIRTGQLAYAESEGNLHITTNGSSWTELFASTGIPAARLEHVSTVNISTGTWTAIPFTQEALDTHGGHSNVTNTSRYTAQKAGWYRISGGVGLVVNSTGWRGTRTAKNGSAIQSSEFVVSAASGVGTVLAVRSILVSLAVGDYVEIYVHQTSGGSLATSTGADGASMDIHYVRAA